MVFEVFDPAKAKARWSAVRLDAPPMVTVRKPGQIALNRAAANALGDPRYVELLCDREARAFALRACADSEGYRVTWQGPGARTVTCTAFLDHLGLRGGDSVRWPASVEDGLLIVDYAAPGEPVSRQRRPSDKIASR